MSATRLGAVVVPILTVTASAYVATKTAFSDSAHNNAPSKAQPVTLPSEGARTSRHQHKQFPDAPPPAPLASDSSEFVAPSRKETTLFQELAALLVVNTRHESKSDALYQPSPRPSLLDVLQSKIVENPTEQEAAPKPHSTPTEEHTIVLERRPASPPPPPSQEKEKAVSVSDTPEPLGTFDDPTPPLPKESIIDSLSPSERASFQEFVRILKEAGFEGGRLAITGTIGVACIHPLTRLMLATAGKEPLRQAFLRIAKNPTKDMLLSAAPGPWQFFGIAFAPTAITLLLQKLSSDDESTTTKTLQSTAATATGGAWETYRSGGPNADLLSGKPSNPQFIRDSLNPLKMPGATRLSVVQFGAHATRNMASTGAMNDGVKYAKEVTNPLLERVGVKHTKEDGSAPTTIGLVLSATLASVAASIASSPFNQAFCLKTESPTMSFFKIGKEILTKPGRMALAMATRTMRTGPLVAIIIFLNEKSKEFVPNPYSLPAENTPLVEEGPTQAQKTLGEKVAKRLEADDRLSGAKTPEDVIQVINQTIEEIQKEEAEAVVIEIADATVKDLTTDITAPQNTAQETVTVTPPPPPKPENMPDTEKKQPTKADEVRDTKPTTVTKSDTAQRDETT